MLKTISQTEINYRDTSLSDSSGGGRLRSGDRFPWFTWDGSDSFKWLGQRVMSSCPLAVLHLSTLLDGGAGQQNLCARSNHRCRTSIRFTQTWQRHRPPRHAYRQHYQWLSMTGKIMTAKMQTYQGRQAATALQTVGCRSPRSVRTA